MSRPSEQDVLGALSRVAYPGFSRDVVSLGAVRRVAVEDGGVTVDLAVPEGQPDLVARLEAAVREALEAIPGAGSVRVRRAGSGARGVRPLPAAGRPTVRSAPPPAPRPIAANIIGVASGKGGVGKSTVAVNVAVTLARAGRRVGFLDADVHGPSAPLMFGVQSAKPGRAGEDGRPRPIEAHGIAIMSMGFFVERGSAVIWRGPIVGNFIRQLLTEVDWGELDDLVIDFPPGTGDAQLTISQTLAMSGAIIVTTPNDLALIDAVKAIAMFRKVEVPVLGIVENMATFVCPHCAEETSIFGPSGTEEAAREHGVPIIGRVPIDPQVVVDSDQGTPVVAARPDSPAARAYKEIADAVLAALPAAASGDARPRGFLERFGR